MTPEYLQVRDDIAANPAFRLVDGLSIRFVAPVIIACLMAASSAAQTAREKYVEPPRSSRFKTNHRRRSSSIRLCPPLSRGRVVIQYRTDNLHIVPVFGPAALAVSPRVGHIHVTVDGGPWVWADASGEPVVLSGLPPGPHKVLLQLETANHQTLDEGAVMFTVPTAPSGAPAVARMAPSEPPAKIIIDAPVAEALSRGVLFIQYRTENLQMVPVFGLAALAVVPRIGHIHVTVDDAAWHWADASGNPVIINGLAPGSHKVLIQLVDANHQPVDQEVVRVTVPTRGQ